jgi:hypothetical protein
MGTETMKATHEGHNYLKAARKIDCPGSYTEVNGEAMVKIYSQRQRCGEADSGLLIAFDRLLSTLFMKGRGSEGNTCSL